MDVEGALEELPRLDRATLYRRYRDLYGIGAPPRFSRQLLILAIAHRIQATAYGDLKPSIRKSILSGQAPTPASRSASAGTMLLREWHGMHHSVTVHEDGVEYQGQRYGSLSEVARRITGQRRSGPAFFGLKGLAHE